MRISKDDKKGNLVHLDLPDTFAGGPTPLVPAAGQTLRRHFSAGRWVTVLEGAAGPVGPVDPHWDNVVLCLDFEGTVGSQTFTDRSKYARAATISGAAINLQLVDAQKKVGSQSLFKSATSLLGFTIAPELKLAGSNFTLEGWFRFGATLPSAAVTFFSSWASGQRSWSLQYTGTATNKLALQSSNDGNTNNTAQEVNFTPTANTWYHIVMCRHGRNVRMFIDGVMVQSVVWGDFRDSTAPFRIGNLGDSTSNGFSGHIDQVRFTKGVCRYPTDAAFTPSTDPYPTQGPAVNAVSNQPTNDPHWAKVLLLAQFNKPNTEAGYLNDAKGRVGTKFGANSAQMDIGPGKFGTAMVMPARAANVYFAGPTDFPIGGAVPFTIEGWVKPSKLHESQSYFINKQNVLSNRSFHFGFFLNQIRAQWFESGTSNVHTLDSPMLPDLHTDVWSHICWDYDGAVHRIYHNGVMVGSRVNAVTFTASNSSFLTLGSESHSNGFDTSTFLGAFDEVRITRDVARYAGTNFPVPTGPYPAQ